MTTREKIDLKMSRFHEIEDQLGELEKNRVSLVLEKTFIERELRELSVSLKSQLSTKVVLDTRSYFVW